MATHSSPLAWRTPWTEEPGGLQSMGSHRVGHNRSDLACTRHMCREACPPPTTQTRDPRLALWQPRLVTHSGLCPSCLEPAFGRPSGNVSSRGQLVGIFWGVSCC